MKRWLVTLVIGVLLAFCAAANAGGPSASWLVADAEQSHGKDGLGWAGGGRISGGTGGVSTQGAIWPDGIW